LGVGKTKIGRITKNGGCRDALGHCLRIALVLIVPLGSHQGFPVGQQLTDEIFPLLMVRAATRSPSGSSICAHFDEPPCSLLAFVGLGS
jgi:hypothetical protein